MYSFITINQIHTNNKNVDLINQAAGDNYSISIGIINVFISKIR